MSALSSGREEALRKAAAAGEAEASSVAFEALAREVTPRLLALCFRMLGSHDDAADVVQEALLLAFRARDAFRGEASFSTWVTRIALRVAIQHRARRGPPRVPDEDEGGGEAEAGEAPERRLESRELLRRTQAALLKLPAEHRIVLSLFAERGLEHAEIAAILGVPVGTVWRRLHEARRALRARLDVLPGS